jgi:hypothetical protein
LAAHQSNPGISYVCSVECYVPYDWSPEGEYGFQYFAWIAHDPAIGSAWLQCYGSVAGFDCYVTGLAAYIEQTNSASSERNGQSPVEARFWSGLAPVNHSGFALVPVASYSSRQHGTVRELVVLRSKTGAVIGRGAKTMRFDTRTNIDVRLTPSVARTVAGGKSITVRASVTNAHGTVGTGQTTNVLTLTKLTSALGGLELG